MISRLQFSLDLASQKIDGVLISTPSLSPESKLSNLIGQVTQQVGLSFISENSLKIINREMETEPPFIANKEFRPSYISKLSGLIIGSPEFQRR
jgi:hypothetical protein